MRYGYARASIKELSIAVQIRKLEHAGCQKVVREEATSAVLISKRPALAELRQQLQPGDRLVVCSLNLLARSMKDLISTVQQFKERGVQLTSLEEDINTTCPGGKLIFHVFAALARFEHDMIVERTRVGMAKPGAKKAGRKSSLSPHDKVVIRRMIAAGHDTREQIAHTFRVNRSTIYRLTRADPIAVL